MISKFVREQKRYTQHEICSILECSETDVVSYIQKLKEYGVLKVVKHSDSQRDMSDLQDKDIEVTDVETGDSGYFYVFTFMQRVKVFFYSFLFFLLWKASCGEERSRHIYPLEYGYHELLLLTSPLR